MNIDLLSQMVYALILENDKVALPGLGAFVAEMVPATFTDRGYTINPPYRRLSFRSQAADDSLLADLYSSSADVDGELAKREIMEFLSELKGILFAKKNVVFPGLGRLRATRENNVFFVADEDLDIYPEGFGLEPLSLKARRETREDLARTAGHLEGILSAREAGTVGETAATAPELTTEETCSGDSHQQTACPENVTALGEQTREPVSDTAPELTTEETGSGGSHPQTACPENVTATAGAQDGRKGHNPWKAAGITAAVLLAIAALSIGVFLIMSSLAPDFVDSLLYTAEELQIINWKL